MPSTSGNYGLPTWLKILERARSYLPAKHDVEVVSRLALSIYVLPPGVAVVSHAIRERPDFRMGPVFRQGERVLEKVDLSCSSRARKPQGMLSEADWVNISGGTEMTV